MATGLFARFSDVASGQAAAPRGVSADERRLMELCALPLQEALDALATSPEGLPADDAAKRLDEVGPNELSHVKRLGFWADLFQRLKSPLVVQLLIIALVSGVIGEWKSTLIVSAMVVLSVGLSYVLDRRSSRAVESLGKRVQSRAFLLRDGAETEVRISEIVPGDIVLLHAGSIIPADLRLIAAKDFFVSESALTGESMPVEKTSASAATSRRVGPGAAERLFLGSTVTSGTARGVVVNTGARTLFGAISERLADKREETSFDRGVRSFTWLMIRFMVVMVCAVFFIVGLTKGNWVEALLFGLSVAVGLTPEMLPMIVTVNLAKGALTMARKKVIVKRLPSIQNFGAIDILCTDKTGTLTQDRVVLERHVDIVGHASDEVLRLCLPEQLLPDRPAQPARPGRARRTPICDVGAGLPAGGRIALRLSAPPHVGRRGLRGRPRADLQGRRGGDLRLLQPLPGR